MSKTLRMVIPQWQGGVNPHYVLGAQLLAHIAPPSQADETVTIPIATDFAAPLARVDGVDGGDQLLRQMQAETEILEHKRPDRLIVFGGDCAVEQAPFEWLNGRYGGELGLLWLDAHPDIASHKTSAHLHEMVFGNLLGLNPASPITRTAHPYQQRKTMLAGLIAEDLRPMDSACRELGLRIAAPEALQHTSAPVLQWLREENIQRLAVHWDLDVLSPEDYRSIYPAEPHTRVEDFPAAVGRMTLAQIGRLLGEISDQAEIVALGITEHLPWDAFNLRKTLAELPIFQSK